MVRTIGIITILLTPMCMSRQCINTIDTHEVIDELINKKLMIEELAFDVSNLLYLDTALAERLNEIMPEYMEKEGLDIIDFVISNNDKTELKLSAEYQSIYQLLNEMDSNLIDYLRTNFGIEKTGSSICGDALILNNEAFIEFRSESSTQGIIIELDGPRTVKIALAYMLID